MMYKIICGVLIYLTLSIGIIDGYEIEDVKKLKARLFDGVKYDTTIRPIVNQSEAIEVCEWNNKYEYLLILDKKSQRMILCS